MCTGPGKLSSGTQIGCRKCWQCRRERIHDWVGRCIAETKTALACSSIELTYGRDVYGSVDHPSAVILTYSDVQKYFKLLRRHGYPCRYFAVGEYGGKKGRAHWHLIVFWLDKVPAFAGFDQENGEWSNDWVATRFNHQRLDEHGEPVHYDNGEPAYWWPHGWTFVEPLNYASVKYKMKYIQKDIGDMERQGHLSMSKKPPLGSDYFKQEAALWVEQGLAPRDLYYTFPEAISKTGKKVRFRLAGKTAEIFLQEFIDVWERDRPGQNWPKSELLWDFINRPVPGSSDVRRYERLKPFKVEFPKDEKEILSDDDWLRLSRWNRPPRDDELSLWMEPSMVSWDNGPAAWCHPGRIGEQHVSGEPWRDHDIPMYYWHPDFVKGGGQWLVVPPQKKKTA